MCRIVTSTYGSMAWPDDTGIFKQRIDLVAFYSIFTPRTSFGLFSRQFVQYVTDNAMFSIFARMHDWMSAFGAIFGGPQYGRSCRAIPSEVPHSPRDLQAVLVQFERLSADSTVYHGVNTIHQRQEIKTSRKRSWFGLIAIDPLWLTSAERVQKKRIRDTCLPHWQQAYKQQCFFTTTAVIRAPRPLHFCRITSAAE